MKVEFLSKDKISEVTNVFCDAFYDYPVMRYVLGDKPGYKERLQKLIGFFVSARVYREEPMLGVYNSDGLLTAAAVITLPGDIPTPEKLTEHRNALWKELGPDEQLRYETYGKAASSILPAEPHHHLNMIGVLPSYQGKGLARILINKVEELYAGHPVSKGLSLSTETESNVKFYLHIGYALLGKTKVNDGLETWAFFKPK